MSLEEKSKYCYGFDLNKYKVDPNQYQRLMMKGGGPKQEKKVKKPVNSISDDMYQPPPPVLEKQQEKFNIEEAKGDYQ